MSEDSGRYFIPCKSGNNVFADCLIEQHGDMVQVTGHAEMLFTQGDAVALAKWILRQNGKKLPKGESLMRVRKVGGSFQHTGTVVAEFETTDGEKRIVMEFDDPVKGMLQVYRPDQVVEIEEPEWMVDPVVEAVREDLLDRSRAGIAKYGTTLNRTDLTLDAWLVHAYQEGLDQVNYLKRAIIDMKNLMDDGK